MNAEQTQTKVLKNSKNKIKVDFERTSRWEKFKIKYLSLGFLGNFVWYVFRLLLLIGISFVILYPFFSKISSSFMSKSDFVDATVKLIPKYPTLEIYEAIISELSYFKVLLNTFLLSAMCGLVQMFVCCMIGYGLAKYKFKGSNLVFLLVIFTMVIPHETLRFSMFMKFRYFDILGIFKLLGGGVTPLIKVTNFTSLNLLNTFWPLLILSIGGVEFKIALYIFMMRQFFRGVPDELEESAYMDGSGVFRTFIRIILPISVPMMITVFLFSFCWQWADNFYMPMIFTNTRIDIMSNFVDIPKSLNDQSFEAYTFYSAAIRNTCSLLIIAPLMIVYLFCQRYLVQGIERSGITG